MATVASFETTTIRINYKMSSLEPKQREIVVYRIDAVS